MHSSSHQPASSPRIYGVAGMTCQHCVASVTEEVLAVDEVTSASVDLNPGTLEVRGEHFSDEAISAAVAEGRLRGGLVSSAARHFVRHYVEMARVPAKTVGQVIA